MSRTYRRRNHHDKRWIEDLRSETYDTRWPIFQWKKKTAREIREDRRKASMVEKGVDSVTFGPSKYGSATEDRFDTYDDVSHNYGKETANRQIRRWQRDDTRKRVREFEVDKRGIIG